MIVIRGKIVVLIPSSSGLHFRARTVVRNAKGQFQS